MIKKTIITLMGLIILSTIISFNSGIESTADECNDCTQIPSTSGETDYCSINQSNPESKPIIQTSSGVVDADHPITLHINSGSLALPPYNWSVSSAKYTLDKSTTMSNLETVTMTAASGTCSSGYNDSNIYVTVTVTDNCGITSQAIIRNNAGSWQSNVNYCTGSLFENGDLTADVIINQYKYILRYIGFTGNSPYYPRLGDCDGTETFHECTDYQCNNYAFEDNFNQIFSGLNCGRNHATTHSYECELWRNSTDTGVLTSASRQIWGCP